MKKILFVATVVEHIKSFHMPIISELKKNNIVEIASCGTIDEEINYNIPFSRFPFSIRNIKAFYILYKLKYNEYDIVHCHTPVAAMITRIVFKRCETKVVYTAHGFHFYENAPFFNWIVYYPIEKFLSRYTDCLITINEEDYLRSVNNLHAKKNINLNGVGVDIEKFKKAPKTGYNFINPNKLTLLSVGELNKNKNHNFVIEAIKEIDNIQYLIAGEGSLYNELVETIEEQNLSDKVTLLGFRKDIPSILKNVDVFVFPSNREGLPASIIEAMAAGVPVIASDIRGNKDLITDMETGILYKKNSKEELMKAIEILKDKDFRKRMGKSAQEKSEKFDISLILKEQLRIYEI